MANPDLPQEIILEIFSKLPTKSIGKCRTLSKSWNTHFSSNNFIKKHLIYRKQTIQQENLAFITQFNKLYIITSPTKKDELFNRSFPERCFRVCGSCNGLILLAGNKKLFLLNPITRKQVTIQLPQLFTQSKDYDSVMYGLGYDSCSDDYKIVQMSTLSSNRLSKTFVDLYSVKSGVWKMVDGCYPYGGLVPSRYGFEGGAFVNGALHWLIRSNEGNCSCIAAFDLTNQVFNEIPLPKEFVRQLGYEADGLVRPPRRTNGVSVVGGCLLIVDNYGNLATDVWIMKEYGVTESWAKFHIEAQNGKWDPIVEMICYVEGGELLFLTYWSYLFARDLNLGTVRKVVIGDCDGWFSHGMAFVDSLVSPEGPW